MEIFLRNAWRRNAQVEPKGRRDILYGVHLPPQRVWHIHVYGAVNLHNLRYEIVCCHFGQLLE